jgi:hypothetical protein
MDEQIRTLIRDRARRLCEYCRIPECCHVLPFQIDHITAKKHGGTDDPENLAWSCFDCNSFKGPNVAGIDAVTGDITPLFHPRNDAWHEHLQWAGSALRGLTPRGRATIEVLRINLPDRVEHRRLLMASGDFSN